ncbi:response regulator transcription factor [Pedobacter ureilyticus]|uniref:Response regulator transcription factor n=1 Tax=Pedobacter ureilyticus TaxID=1393051 RepID=A0ABW9JAU3_9SPHI|nr:response regulator [Pedobacter helvus]
MRKEITILEDDQDIREICTYVFEAEGFKVNSYSTVSSFMDCHTAPDIYLLDIRLPDGNGLEVCQFLKADPKFSAIPVILMSANYEQSSIKDLCSAESFLAKPFDIELLVDRASQLVNRDH